MTSSAGQDMPDQTGHPCMGQKVFADLNQKLDLWVMGQSHGSKSGCPKNGLQTPDGDRMTEQRSEERRLCS